tara:strand:+ start:2998 stop:3495 length:498 start_codon:yes stop_codon:yes gene_type:complete
MFEYFIGIDPGVNGAVSILGKSGEVVDCFDLPVLMDGNKKTLNTRSIFNKIKEITGDSLAFCTIERVQAMPKQGVSSTFAFGRAFGQLEGIASCMGWSIILVRPRAWQKNFFAFASGSNTKEKSRQVSMGLYPTVDLSLKKHHNKADSLLIAEYGRRYQQMEVSS